MTEADAKGKAASTTAEWRTRGHLDDAVFVIDASGSVLDVLPVTPLVLSRFLTARGGFEHLDTTSSERTGVRDPEAWGRLVMARSGGGEVLEVEPELYWHGIYVWFRSRGVDYDTPDQQWAPLQSAPQLPLSVLMDD
jgi:hypothetical protein